MTNTLIDNSTSQLSMLETECSCLLQDGVLNVSIATDYWDMPGLALVATELEQFLQRDGAKLRLLPLNTVLSHYLMA